MAVNRAVQTTVDMANSPDQRTQPFPETITLLEGMGAKNNHKGQAYKQCAEERDVGRQPG
jgi:hypothetical protein